MLTVKMCNSSIHECAFNLDLYIKKINTQLALIMLYISIHICTYIISFDNEQNDILSETTKHLHLSIHVSNCSQNH